MITAPTPIALTSRPPARGYRDRATAATIAPRTWDMPTPDLDGLHLDRPGRLGHHYIERTADAFMAVALLLFAAGTGWLAAPHMTAPFLFTWTLFVVLYVAGRVSWDAVRRS
jgi:hypothetical protein